MALNKTRIDWCDASLNPVVGCPRGCEYCYARKLNTRYGWIEDWNKPQTFIERLSKLNSKKPKSIFMDSMSDIEFWSYTDCVCVGSSMCANPQHNYIFLTKGRGLTENAKELKTYKDNVFFGRTITNAYQANDWNSESGIFDFYSIEPILEPITIPIFTKLKQIIIGAETGNRKGKVIPKKEWIDSLVKQADEHGIKVFMKESLREIMGADFRQDELIWKIEQLEVDRIKVGE